MPHAHRATYEREVVVAPLDGVRFLQSGQCCCGAHVSRITDGPPLGSLDGGWIADEDLDRAHAENVARNALKAVGL
jgi:hypothetical protein